MLAGVSARRGIRFYTPNVVLDVNLHAVKAIRDELEKIAATNPPRADVTRVLDALDLHIVKLVPDSPTYTPDDRERAVLLRATDHLRNLGHRGDVLDLRDMLCGTGAVQPIGYRLRGVTGGPPREFVSYSLPYYVGERLVDASGSEHRIAGLGLGDASELVVDEWRAAE
jgi:hypothetical protein